MEGQGVAAWISISLAIAAFGVAQVVAIVRGFASLATRLTSIESKLGDRDSGLIHQVGDHEDRIRVLERASLLQGFKGGSIPAGDERQTK